MRRLIFILLAMIGVSQAQTIQYIGAPTTTVISRGNFRTDSIFYLPKRSKAPTDTAAFRYQISDSSLYVWTGSQWVKAGGSGTISGSGITGYLPQFNGTTTIDTSALFTLGNRLGIGTSTFAYNSTNTANMELNGTAGGILGFKRNDSARGYLWHTGDNMELANTVAGSIFFNTNSATRGSISSAGVWRLHNLAGTGDRVVIASSNGTLSASTSVTGLVDTTTISTRAWRQKGDDSLGAIIATKGNGTVTSVATGYGLSGGTITTTGTLLVDTLNIATRAWRQKGLDSLAALEVSGSGTTNYVPKFTAGSTIGNSQIVDNAASGVSIGAKTLIRDDGPFITGSNISGAGNNFAIGTTGGSSLMLYTNSSQRVQIAADGNVGIGATGSLLPLTVYNPTLNTPVLEVRGGGGSSQTRINLSYGNTTSTTLNGDIFASTTDFALRAQAGRNMWFGTDAVSGSTNRMQIFANGRVFIGASPTDAGYQLDVNGTLRSVNGANFATTSGNVGIGTASPTNAKLVVEGSSAGTVGAIMSTDAAGTTSFVRMVGDVGSENLLNWQTGTSLRFATSTQAYGTFAEHARINSNGELLIATTTDAGDYKLQVSGNIYNTGSAVLAATSGELLVGTTSDAGDFKIQTNGAAFFGIASTKYAIINNSGGNTGLQSFGDWTNHLRMTYPSVVDFDFQVTSTGELDLKRSSTVATRVNSAMEFMINTTTDAGDYKLQVVGNARIGTGKLDIASNTVYGLGVARSGTSEVAGQIYNSNGILYLGAESSAGGQIFSGSSAYAAVIGSGANYPLQFAVNNVTRATINTNGELLINTTTDNGDFKLQVNGNALVSGSIKTANGGSSTAVPWHLGSVVATNVQLDTANYVEVEINGVFYRLAIVTPL